MFMQYENDIGQRRNKEQLMFIAVRDYYGRDREDLEYSLEAVRNHPSKFYPMWWKRFLIDANEFLTTKV